MLRPLLVGSLLLLAAPLAAQDTNPVNLFVADLRYERGTVRVGTPVKLTRDNGSNSQPSFTPDGRAIVFSARRDSANGEVYRIDLATGVETRVTATPENENSPTIGPRGELMVVRWKPETLFREWGLWEYAGGRPARSILPAPDTVGYYTRIDANTFALMRPAARFTVALFDARTGRTVDVDGPAAPLPPRPIPGERAVSFTRTDSAGRNQIRRVELASRRVTPVAATVTGRTSHVWARGNIIVMGKGNTLYAMKPGRDSAWTPIATFTAPDMRNVTAYAVSPRGDRLVLTSTARVPLHTALRDSIESGIGVAAATDRARALRAAGGLARYEVSEAGIGGLGSYWLAWGKPADAAALFALQAELFPASYRPHLGLGDAAAARGDREGAIRHFRRSLELNPRASDGDRAAADRATAEIGKLGGA
ncbi:MAG TPA: hypothetical protein VE913_18115 [Longimicrobium sp.]|nr:hypothetical protein [Longimicrobium sp.]